MPIYEYRCQNGHKFQATHGSEERVTRCVECDAPVQKLVSSFSFPRIWNGKGVWVLDRYGRSPDWGR